MRRMRRQLLFAIGFVAVWWLVADLQIWPSYIFPSPRGVIEALRWGFKERTFLVGLGISLRRIALGYGLSVSLGVTLGCLIAASQFLKDSLGGALLSMQSLPSLCWLPLAVLWFGLTEKAILFVVVMGSLLSVAINTELGLRHVPNIYMMAGRNLGARGPRLITRVLLPASLPHLVAGLKQGWAFAWRSLISGEMLFVSLGLGHLLMMGRDLNDVNQVVAVMVLIVAIGYVVDRLIFEKFENHLRQKWGLSALA
jgi:NitT/TauT family transport system permease protein